MSTSNFDDFDAPKYCDLIQEAEYLVSIANGRREDPDADEWFKRTHPLHENPNPQTLKPLLADGRESTAAPVAPSRIFIRSQPKANAESDQQPMHTPTVPGLAPIPTKSALGSRIAPSSAQALPTPSLVNTVSSTISTNLPTTHVPLTSLPSYPTISTSTPLIASAAPAITTVPLKDVANLNPVSSESENLLAHLNSDISAASSFAQKTERQRKSRRVSRKDSEAVLEQALKLLTSGGTDLPTTMTGAAATNPIHTTPYPHALAFTPTAVSATTTPISTATSLSNPFTVHCDEDTGLQSTSLTGRLSSVRRSGGLTATRVKRYDLDSLNVAGSTSTSTTTVAAASTMPVSAAPSTASAPTMTATRAIGGSVYGQARKSVTQQTTAPSSTGAFSSKPKTTLGTWR